MPKPAGLPNPGDLRTTQVYGRQARVELDQDTYFLTSFADGWKINAAGCTPPLGELQDPVPWSDCLLTADFWSRTLQNWQSELLAIGSMAIFAVFLRQRGSPESKPVGAAHTSTGVEG